MATVATFRDLVEAAENIGPQLSKEAAKALVQASELLLDCKDQNLHAKLQLVIAIPNACPTRRMLLKRRLDAYRFQGFGELTCIETPTGFTLQF